MQRLIAVVIIFATIIGICFYANYAVSEVCIKIEDELSLIEKKAVSNEWEYAKNEVADIREFWDKNKRKMSVFVNHGDVENFTIALKKLEIIAAEENIAEFRIQLNEIKQIAEIIVEEQRFTLDCFI